MFAWSIYTCTPTLEKVTTQWSHPSYGARCVKAHLTSHSATDNWRKMFSPIKVNFMNYEINQQCAYPDLRYHNLDLLHLTVFLLVYFLYHLENSPNSIIFLLILKT